MKISLLAVLTSAWMHGQNAYTGTTETDKWRKTTF